MEKKRVYITKSYARPENTDDERFQHLQSMILYQLVGFYRDEQHRLTAHTFHNATIQMFRQVDLVALIKKAAVPTPFGLTGPELEAAWKARVKVETWRRVAVIVYLLDLEFATRPQRPSSPSTGARKASKLHLTGSHSIQDTKLQSRRARHDVPALILPRRAEPLRCAGSPKRRELA